jgi:hypothetical protein
LCDQPFRWNSGNDAQTLLLLDLDSRLSLEAASFGFELLSLMADGLRQSGG